MAAQGYLVELKGLDDAQLDHDERTITASISLAAGAERKVEMRVLAPRDSAGDALSVSMHLAHFHTMSEAWVHRTITVDTRRSPQESGNTGGGLTSAGVVTVIWLVVTSFAVALTGVMVGGRRGFFSPRAGVVAIMVAIGFWLVFAGMAWRDYRVLNEWTASTATIVGRRVVHHTVNSQSRTTGGTSRSSDVAKPEFALRYVVQGRDMLSTGYDTGSSLRVGGGKAQLEKEFQEWTVGAQVPCWYDPRDPADVVLKRGYGGAYLFALLPLLPFALGWFILRSALSGKP
ncbi:DUF3592 domain-containing protein [Brevifollis gellanilyticus]|uniref:DUF3592 domain-containing protein n=1 Tax=Brevifollis gellanilyticus TaxID=748831 RepID=A0A512M5J7_9BACT|nr:DUF3592 domain-containing protein [Brevifollis gellanilyticus]GEP41631.1 hypothetical protein BGE01nite_09220 [Brevifollis gellanilyticus]